MKPLSNDTLKLVVDLLQAGMTSCVALRIILGRHLKSHILTYEYIKSYREHSKASTFYPGFVDLENWSELSMDEQTDIRQTRIREWNTHLTLMERDNVETTE